MYIFLPNPGFKLILYEDPTFAQQLELKTNREFVGFSPQFPESSLVHCTFLQSEKKIQKIEVSLCIYTGHCGNDSNIQFALELREETLRTQSFWQMVTPRWPFLFCESLSIANSEASCYEYEAVTRTNMWTSQSRPGCRPGHSCSHTDTLWYSSHSRRTNLKSTSILGEVRNI